jgi:uroporphyrinogen decarboxylase
MTSKERVSRVLSFREADRVPRYLGFSDEFVRNWKTRKGWGGGGELLEHFGSDMVTLAAVETTWPSRAGVVRQGRSETVVRDGWGSLVLRKTGARFEHILEPAVKGRVDPATLEFENPFADSRYRDVEKRARKLQDRQFVIGKTGGPYIRASFMRGREAFLLDMAEDPGWTKAFMERLTDHLIAVGVESIRRLQLWDTGIIVHDDVCSLRGPIMGPKTYEELIYPSHCRMIEAYKKAGAAYYIQHCDGDVRPLLDMWVEAGVDAVNPCEPRSGFDPLVVRGKYGEKLRIIGSLDNTGVLPRGRPEEIEEHVRWLMKAAIGKGFVICGGISEDVSIDTMELFLKLLEERGRYPIVV